MKVEKVPTQKPDIRITLTHEEAEQLHGLLGSIFGGKLYDLYRALGDLLDE